MTNRYELIDYGNGRKLESLAGYWIDRPCAAARGARRNNPGAWRDAGARYDAAGRSWQFNRSWPPELEIDCGAFRMPVRPTPFGHIGLFPEQLENWRWLGQGVAEQGRPQSPLLALNLFAYTGASTLALVTAGFHVAHVDAAKPNVQAARSAAEHNQLGDAPIRYLVDDAAKFVARELRRRRRYHTIVLDPPAYGHAPRSKAWRLERDLWPLLDDCLRLLDPDSFRLLVTGHSPQVGAAEVTRYFEQSGFLRRCEAASGLLLESGRSQLKDSSGRALDAGFYVRASSHSG